MRFTNTLALMPDLTSQRSSFITLIISIVGVVVGALGIFFSFHFSTQQENAPFVARADLIGFSDQVGLQGGKQELIVHIDNQTTEQMLHLDIVVPDPLKPSGTALKMYEYMPHLGSCMEGTFSEILGGPALTQVPDAYIVFQLFDRHWWSLRAGGNPVSVNAPDPKLFPPESPPDVPNRLMSCNAMD